MRDEQMHRLARWLLEHRKPVSQDSLDRDRYIWNLAQQHGIKHAGRLEGLTPQGIRHHCNRHRTTLLEIAVTALLEEVEEGIHA